MRNRGFSKLELLVVIFIIGFLAALLFPALVRTRGPSRRATCQNNLRQIVLAMTNYQSAQQCFPSLRGIKGFDGVGSSDQLGPLVKILPYLDEGERYERISKGCVIQSKQYPAFRALNSVGFEPWEEQIPMFQCSNVPPVADSSFAVTHYGFCIGDRARNIATPKSLRGCFAGSLHLSFDDISDGASNTIIAAEIGARTHATRENRWAISQPDSFLESPVECFELVDSNSFEWQFNEGVPLSPIGRGSHWADGRAGVGAFNTILPPNSPSAAVSHAIDVDGIYSASSPHTGGLNVARADGSIAFISADIDAGNSSQPAPTEDEMAAGVPSPYGVWGALGTISGGETIDDF